MSFDTLIKRLENIMRGDDLAGKVQYLRQMVWMIFLKIYDAKEYEWEFTENYESIIPDYLKWREWAEDNFDGKALTGDELIYFVNNILFKNLKEIPIDENTPKKHRIVKYIFEDAANYMKDGTKLRQMINALNEVDFTDYKDAHEFGDMYESMLKDLTDSKRDGGEYYTPRALTDFIVEMVEPDLGQTIGDFACGTGGFLISALMYLTNKYAYTSNPEDRNIINNSLIGVEKKSFPYSLGLTNLILHDVDEPNIYYDNSLKYNVREFDEKQLVDIIVMNPPYGGTEDDIVKTNFPSEHRSSETADLFMSAIIHRLKLNGKCGVVLPDGFLFGDDNAKLSIKKQLLDEFDLHTIIRLPKSVFAPYTSITTNILFFSKNGNGTFETWFYRMDLPEGYKAFSKTKPIMSRHFDDARNWWKSRVELKDEEGNFKSKKYTKVELEELNYNFDLCGFPNATVEILDPEVLINEYLERKQSLNEEIYEILSKIKEILGE
ncbi:class I SAM-dependent DNA methyltransferase [Clostridioides difficile]